MVRSSSASLWRSCDWCSSCCWGITALLLPGKISHLTGISLHLKFFPQVDTRRSPLSQQSISVNFLGILWVLKLPDSWKSSIKLVWSDRYRCTETGRHKHLRLASVERQVTEIQTFSTFVTGFLSRYAGFSHRSSENFISPIHPGTALFHTVFVAVTSHSEAYWQKERKHAITLQGNKQINLQVSNECWGTGLKADTWAPDFKIWFACVSAVAVNTERLNGFLAVRSCVWEWFSSWVIG